MVGTLDRVERGKLGEELACEELASRGYAIIARRFRSRFGEIDIIAQRDGVIVFVEVKARASARFGTAAESLPAWKRRRISAMALDYLASVERLDARCRVDVVAIDGIGKSGMTIKVFENAFDSGAR
jgi:putative endonuclease